MFVIILEANPCCWQAIGLVEDGLAQSDNRVHVPTNVFACLRARLTCLLEACSRAYMHVLRVCRRVGVHRLENAIGSEREFQMTKLLKRKKLKLFFLVLSIFRFFFLYFFLSFFLFFFFSSFFRF